MRMVGRARDLSELEIRCCMDGFSGGARKAMEKSRAEHGEDGVTMIAGRCDFSVTIGRERSGGMSI